MAELAVFANDGRALDHDAVLDHRPLANEHILPDMHAVWVEIVRRWVGMFFNVRLEFFQGFPGILATREQFGVRGLAQIKQITRLEHPNNLMKSSPPAIPIKAPWDFKTGPKSKAPGRIVRGRRRALWVNGSSDQPPCLISIKFIFTGHQACSHQPPSRGHTPRSVLQGKGGEVTLWKRWFSPGATEATTLQDCQRADFGFNCLFDMD